MQPSAASPRNYDNYRIDSAYTQSAAAQKCGKHGITFCPCGGTDEEKTTLV